MEEELLKKEKVIERQNILNKKKSYGKILENQMQEKVNYKEMPKDKHFLRKMNYFMLTNDTNETND